MLRNIMLTIMTIGIVAGQSAPRSNMYPSLLRVTEYDGNTVIAVDANDYEWEFTADGDDWMEGDFCAVIMDDKGTKDIFDDEIVQARYVGAN